MSLNLFQKKHDMLRCSVFLTLWNAINQYLATSKPYDQLMIKIAQAVLLYHLGLYLFGTV